MSHLQPNILVMSGGNHATMSSKLLIKNLKVWRHLKRRICDWTLPLIPAIIELISGNHGQFGRASVKLTDASLFLDQ